MRSSHVDKYWILSKNLRLFYTKYNQTWILGFPSVPPVNGPSSLSPSVPHQCISSMLRQGPINAPLRPHQCSIKTPSMLPHQYSSINVPINVPPSIPPSMYHQSLVNYPSSTSPLMPPVKDLHQCLPSISPINVPYHRSPSMSPQISPSMYHHQCTFNVPHQCLINTYPIRWLAARRGYSCYAYSHCSSQLTLLKRRERQLLTNEERVLGVFTFSTRILLG